MTEKVYRLEVELTQEEVNQLCDLFEAATYSDWTTEEDDLLLAKLTSAIKPNPYLESGVYALVHVKEEQ